MLSVKSQNQNNFQQFSHFEQTKHKPTRAHSWFRNALILTAFGTAAISGIDPLAAQGPNSPRPLTLPPSSQRGTPVVQSPTANQVNAANSADARIQIYALPTEYVAYVVAQLQGQFGADKRVRITTEPETGRLMVLAPEATQQQIASSLAAITKQLSPVASDVSGRVLSNTVQAREYKLQRVSWRELEDAVMRIAGPRLSVSTTNNGELAHLQMLTDA